MELTTESDIYAPSIDAAGKYIDKMPSFNVVKNGVRCPCGTRKDKRYDTYNMFSAHMKSKTHQKWIENLNANKTNFFVENESLKITVQNQRIIIARMDNELQAKNTTIEYLTNQLNTRDNSVLVNDLLSFD
jgi:hypothetical protein